MSGFSVTEDYTHALAHSSLAASCCFTFPAMGHGTWGGSAPWYFEPPLFAAGRTVFDSRISAQWVLGEARLEIITHPYTKERVAPDLVSQWAIEAQKCTGALFRFSDFMETFFRIYSQVHQLSIFELPDPQLVRAMLLGPEISFGLLETADWREERFGSAEGAPPAINVPKLVTMQAR